MNMKEWEYLKVIASEGNISRAAEKLYMAQSSLSHYIKQLEAEMGAPLLIRTSKGVRLTQAGEVLLRHSERMMREYDMAQAEIADMADLKKGTIRIGISTFRGTYLFPPILKAFCTRYPGVSIVLTELDSVDLVQEVAAGNLDIALVAAQAIPAGMGPVDVCMRDEVCVIAPSSHPINSVTHPLCPATGRPWVEPKALQGHGFILGSRSTILGAFANEFFKAEDVYPRILNSGISALFATALVRDEVGLAFSYGSFSPFCPGITYLSIGPEARFIDLALIYPANGTRSKACRALRDLFFEFGRRRPELENGK